jgi:hypothetical protein
MIYAEEDTQTIFQREQETLVLSFYTFDILNNLFLINSFLFQAKELDWLLISQLPNALYEIKKGLKVNSSNFT